MREERLRKRRDELMRAVEDAPIVRAMGMRLSYNESGGAVWTMPYNPAFDHVLTGVHGGVFATLLDNAGWFTIAPHYDNWIATVEFHVRLLAPVQRQDLRAVGHRVRCGKRLAVARMEVETVADGKIVAIGSGTFAPTSVKGLFDGERG